MISTPAIVLHTTPYGESSVIVKAFTRLLGVRSYIIKGVRGRNARVKQNLLQPLSCLDMVVYDNAKTDLNYVKEIAPRGTCHEATPYGNALRFFMTEVLYKALQEAEPMPALFDYVEATGEGLSAAAPYLPVTFLLAVTHHLGIAPLDNYRPAEPLFDLQGGCFVAAPSETTLNPALSALLHDYLTPDTAHPSALADRRALIDALLAYCQLHLSGFRNFTSHEILHTVLK